MKDLARRGQITAETATLIVFGVAALVGTAVYVQRAMQGGVFGTVQSYGSQFDPRDVRTDRQDITITETLRQQVGAPMVEARIVEATPLKREAGARPFKHPQWVLESLPSGAVPREPAYQETSEATTTWKTTGTSSFEDAR